MIFAAIPLGLGGVYLVLGLGFVGALPPVFPFVVLPIPGAAISYIGGMLEPKLRFVLPPILMLPQLMFCGLPLLFAGEPFGAVVALSAIAAGAASWLAAMWGSRPIRAWRTPKHICRTCGYNLVGQRKRDPCPECGEVPDWV